MVKKHIAIILARGGSKRLPGKNILDFHGKPMLVWTVEAALRSQQYQHVIVSTDDPEIAQIGSLAGAEVPFLRSSAADDMSSSSQATLVALRQAEEYFGETYAYVSQLMANCPMRNDEHIKQATENFFDVNATSQISCFKFGWMNPWWAATVAENGKPTYLFPESRNSRSQDLKELFCPTGAIWLAQAEALKKYGTFYAPDHVFYPLDMKAAVDIDDQQDLDFAKALFLSTQE